MQQDLTAVVRSHLADPDTGWGIGTFGAIAEFLRDSREPVRLRDLERLTVATARGAIRLRIGDPVRPVAYEMLSGDADGWMQGLAICLPAGAARMGRRTVLTELGLDAGAILDEDRDEVLFDLGLGIPHLDACIRTRDPALLAVLRASSGRPLLAPDNPAMRAIVRASPHRVFVSRLGRIEVCQPIGCKATPEGPHTHVLPDILALGRTHSANMPVPACHLSCLNLYPANPLADMLGRRKPFDPRQHAAFQALLAAWGVSEHMAEKQRVWTALRNGVRPDDYAPPMSRLARRALRIALRQWAQTEGASPLLEAWRERFDRAATRPSTEEG